MYRTNIKQMFWNVNPQLKEMGAANPQGSGDMAFSM